MQLLRPLTAAALLLTLLGACDLQELVGGAEEFDPTDLTYRLIPSGDPEIPQGLLLEWTPPTSALVAAFDVYARSSAGGDWILRATTTSPSFHDAGVPQLQYFVVAADEDGNELGRSESVTVDERNRLPAPAELLSITLNRAVQLSWSRNAYNAAPTQFDYYRVYSAPYEAAASRCTPGAWALEGSTVTEAFLAANLSNGVTRCFAVSAVSRDGHESTWSPVRLDTPRPDARGVLVDAFEVKPASSGFLFADAGGRFGVVTDGSRADVDFRVERRADGTLWFRLVRADTRVAVFGSSTILDLPAIDRVPSGASFATGAVEAVPGWGYLFSVRQADGTHYAAVRVSYATDDYVVLEWAYQSAVGNPELLRADTD